MNLDQKLADLEHAIRDLQQRPTPADGAPGKDGATVEEVVEAVLRVLPKPETVNYEYLISRVRATIPPGRDGRDGLKGDKGEPGPPGTSVNVSDVALITLTHIKNKGMIPKAADVVAEVQSKIELPPPGKDGRDGKDGKNGKDGRSITRVELKNNELFVWLEEQKKKVGKIELPALGGAGGGSVRNPVNNVPVSNPGAVVTIAGLDLTLIDSAIAKVGFNSTIEDDFGFFSVIDARWLPTVPGTYGFKPTLYVNSGTPNIDCQYTFFVYKNGSLHQAGGTQHIFNPDPRYISDYFQVKLNGTTDYVEIFMQGTGDGMSDHIIYTTNARLNIARIN